MVHRLTENRLFLVTLAALMLVAFMPWQGALGCQGQEGANGSWCCCCGAKDAPATASCCSAPSTPAPEPPHPCPCIQIEQAVGLPAMVGPDGNEQGMVALQPAVDLVVLLDRQAVELPKPLWRARNGPLLHIRLQVLLI